MNLNTKHLLLSMAIVLAGVGAVASLGIVSLLAIEAIRIRHHALTVPPPPHYFRPD